MLCVCDIVSGFSIKLELETSFVFIYVLALNMLAFGKVVLYEAEIVQKRTHERTKWILVTSRAHTVTFGCKDISKP